MSTILTVAVVLVGLFVTFMVGLNVFIRLRAGAMRGKPLPELPGRTGKAIAGVRSGLVYFFSPQCGACRAITPQVRAAAQKNKSVFAIDVTQELELARAMRIMATPSTVEVAQGRVVQVHVGMLPAGLLERFASSC